MKHKIIYTWLFFLLAMISQAQSLEDYLKIAVENNPELQSRQYMYESALEKVNEVGSLPSTKISGGYFIQEPETRVGAQRAKLSASQSLPWFGTLSAKKESALYKAEALQNEMDNFKRQLFLDVKRSFYQLYELNAIQTIYQENIEILKTYERISLNNLENNRTSMVDVLKIKMEINENIKDHKNILNKIQANNKTFNLLLNRTEDSEVILPESLLIEDIGMINKEMIFQNPKLIQFDNLQNSLVSSEKATKKEGLPVIGVGLDYVFVDNRNVANLIDNGKDIIMPMVSVSVPLFSKKYTSKRKQLQLEQKAIESSKENTIIRLNSVYENALANRENALATIKTQEENIIQAEQAHKVLLRTYQTGRMDFSEILEIQQLKLKFHLTKIKAEKEYAIQMAILQYLTTEN